MRERDAKDGIILQKCEGPCNRSTEVKTGKSAKMGYKSFSLTHTCGNTHTHTCAPTLFKLLVCEGVCSKHAGAGLLVEPSWP